MKKSVCYVDDDRDELRRFRNTFQDRYILGTGTTLKEALDDLGNNKPDLFLLDLYFGPIPTADQRRKMLKADAKLTKHEQEVRLLLAKFKQTPEGGFSLADQVATRCPGVPRVLFSRKAFLKDAMQAHEKDLPLLEKPDPEGGEDLDAALKRNAEQIIRKIDQIVYQNSFWAWRGQRSPQLSKRVFVVHGHDEGPREAVARFLERIKLEPIILHERPNRGRAIIAKFQEEAADVGFAVVLMTPDDCGGKVGAATKPRARQNVVFELGFFIGALGPGRVAAMVKGDIERPSDLDGVVYISLDDGSWKDKLGRELEAAGLT
jgi:predicted nucleotide-binding protein